MSVEILGVRHHGPGSARSLRQALEQLRPDAVLVEGPPDAAGVLPLLAHPEMRPPVALLVYIPDQPERAVYYPFAVFSPEWQALHYGLTHGVTVRFMDLPQAHRLAVPRPPASDEGSSDEESPPGSARLRRVPGARGTYPRRTRRSTKEDTVCLSSSCPFVSFVDTSPALPGHTARPQEGAQPPTPEGEQDREQEIRQDPLRWLAEAAGYSDGERWWEHMVEQRRDSADLFAAILELMTALRDATPPCEDPVEAQREAYMRQTIRAAVEEGFQRVAVVCGAWHAPALATLPDARRDATLLKGLPRIKVEATWVPWTHGRLTFDSGYGAGIESPGWYHHLWTAPDRVAIRWMARVARLLREEDLDASSAHIIEAVRLAEALASLRERPMPGLPELSEATQAVLCSGGDVPMRLIHEKLVVGEMLGQVPAETPMVPLQRDLLAEQKRLRLPAEATQRTIDLDLRRPNDLERSHLLHRLSLLGITWGQVQRVVGKIGTFHEVWQLQWQPELAVSVIESSAWGNTVGAAATARARNAADRAPDLPALTVLLDRTLLADLPEATGHLMARLQAEAALAGDVGHLMEALPPLARVLRYGNVRQTDASAVGAAVDGLVARICIGLPGACSSLDDDAAAGMLDRLTAVDGAVALLQNVEHREAWRSTLARMADRQGLHGLLAGRCCRILLDQGVLDAAEVSRRMSLALSRASEPTRAARWLEGFLQGSGLLLLHDDALWRVLDDWVASLQGDAFTALLPLLRRVFSSFPAPERRQIGERVRQDSARPTARMAVAGFDRGRAEAVLPLVARLLGLGDES